MPDGDTTAALAEVKARLEIKKIELEIAELQKPWWQRVSMSAPTATVIVALIGFVGIWQSGYFDRQKEKLEEQVGNLKIERDKILQETKSAIEQYANTISSFILTDFKRNINVYGEKDDFFSYDLGRFCSNSIHAMTVQEDIIGSNVGEVVSYLLTEEKSNVGSLIRESNKKTELYGQIDAIVEDIKNGKTANMDQLFSKSAIASDNLTAQMWQKPLFISEDEFDLCRHQNNVPPDALQKAVARVLEARAELKNLLSHIAAGLAGLLKPISDKA